jgi:hypothetical protein
LHYLLLNLVVSICACHSAGTQIVAPIEFASLSARKVVVENIYELQSSLAQARPGDLIDVEDGEYRTSKPLLINRSGTDDRPIVIRARNRGKASITGTCGFLLQNTEHISIEGFVFTHEATRSAIQMEGCRYVRITRNQFFLREATATRVHWLNLGGAGSHHNRIDHNLFVGKRNAGCFIAVGGSGAPQFTSSQFDRIDHNHFHDRPPGDGNGYESVRLGLSTLAHSSGYTILEFNLFERCDGEGEIVSVKTCDQTIRFNTFRDCYGMLTLRGGHRNIVEGNFFLVSSKKQGSQGVRLYGDDHRVINNYFQGLDGAAILVPTGDIEGGDNLGDEGGATRGAYLRPRRTVIAFNTVIDCRKGLLLIGDPRSEYPLGPIDLVIANNLVVGREGFFVTFQSRADQLKWLGNIFWATDSKAKVGAEFSIQAVRVANPGLVKDETLWRLYQESPARDAAVGSFPEIKTDIDGQPRDSKPDVGADEYSAFPIIHHPLIADNVGVNAL